MVHIGPLLRPGCTMKHGSTLKLLPALTGTVGGVAFPAADGDLGAVDFCAS